MDSDEPRVHRPRRYTALKTSLCFSGAGTGGGSTIAGVQLGGNKLSAPFPSTAIQGTSPTAASHALEKAVNLFSLPVRLIPQMLFHGSIHPARSPSIFGVMEDAPVKLHYTNRVYENQGETA